MLNYFEHVFVIRYVSPSFFCCSHSPYVLMCPDSVNGKAVGSAMSKLATTTKNKISQSRLVRNQKLWPNRRPTPLFIEVVRRMLRAERNESGRSGKEEMDDDDDIEDATVLSVISAVDAARAKRLSKFDVDISDIQEHMEQYTLKASPLRSQRNEKVTCDDIESDDELPPMVHIGSPTASNNDMENTSNKNMTKASNTNANNMDAMRPITAIHYDAYMVEDCVQLISFVGLNLKFINLEIDAKARIINVKFETSNTVPPPPLKNIELFKIAKEPAVTITELQVPISGRKKLSPDDFLVYKVSETQSFIAYTLDTSKCSELFNLRSSIDAVPSSQDILRLQKHKNMMKCLISSGDIMYLDQRDLTESMEPLFNGKVKSGNWSSDIAAIDWDEWRDNVIMKYEVVIKYVQRGELITRDELVLQNQRPLICTEDKLSELLGAFLLIKFGDNDALDLCVVMSPPNSGGAAVLNLDDASLQWMNLQEKEVFVA